MQIAKVKSVAKMGPRAYQTTSFSKLEGIMKDPEKSFDLRGPEEPEDLLIFEHLASHSRSQQKNSQREGRSGRQESTTTPIDSQADDQSYSHTPSVTLRRLSVLSQESISVSTQSVRNSDKVAHGSSHVQSTSNSAKDRRS